MTINYNDPRYKPDYYDNYTLQQLLVRFRETHKDAETYSEVVTHNMLIQNAVFDILCEKIYPQNNFEGLKEYLLKEKSPVNQMESTS